MLSGCNYNGENPKAGTGNWDRDFRITNVTATIVPGVAMALEPQPDCRE